MKKKVNDNIMSIHFTKCHKNVFMALRAVPTLKLFISFYNCHLI